MGQFIYFFQFSVNEKIRFDLCNKDGKLRVAIKYAASVWLIFSTQAAYASDELGWRKGDIVVSAGIAAIKLNTSSQITIGGTLISDGGIKLSNSTVPSGSLEYFTAPDFSLVLVAGLPPKTRVSGTGSLNASGEMGQVRYGLGSLVGRYHFNAAGRFSPFFGVGLSRFIVFKTTDGSITDLKANDAWAPVAQAGFDNHLTDRIGLYFAATYIPVKTKASGSTRGLPVAGSATLKALNLKSGISYRF